MRFKLFTEEDARKYLSRLAKDAQVPEPKLIISDEPFKNLPSDVDWDRPAFYSRKEKAIYIRPKKSFSSCYRSRVCTLSCRYQG